MIHLLIVGDGERDARTVPRLIERILEEEIRNDWLPWARLHRGNYRRKVLFATRQARDAKADGLVAIVDADKTKNHERLKEMKKAREDDRQSLPPFPTALGEAIPHGESWLIDDPVAVRQALKLTIEVPNYRDCNYPKDDLQKLIQASIRAGEELLDLLEDIARQVDGSRCVHDKESGFHGFREEVVAEIGPLRGS